MDSDPTASLRDRSPAGKTLAGIGLVAAVVWVAGFLTWVVSQRLGYPFELEWMEGAMVDHVQRVRSGAPLYAPPSYDHVAFLYHPGFFFVAAAVDWMVGPGFLALRLVSIGATLGSCLMIWRLVRRDGDPLAGTFAVGVFLASFSLAGCYYDVGRIDPLCTFFLLAGVEASRMARRWPGWTLAGGCFLAAWLTKQTAAVIVPFVVLGCVPGGARRTLLFGSVLAVVCGGTVWALDALHHGWMSYFTLELPRSHGILPEFYLAFWTHDLLPYAPAAVLFGWYLWRGDRVGERFFHGCWILGMVVGAYLSRLHIGGAENVLIPAVAGMSVAGGLGLGMLLRRGTRVFVGGTVVGVVQLAILFLLPFLGRAIPAVPSAEVRIRAQRQVEELRARSGPVFLPWHGYLAVLAGRPPTAHSMAMDDVWRSGNQEVIDQLDRSLRERLAASPSPAVFVDDVNHARLRQLLLDLGYRPTRMLAGPEQEVRPLVGDTTLWPKVVMER